MKKKILSLSMILIISVFTFLPYINVFAEIGYVSKLIGYVKAGEESEYVSSGTNLENFINNKKGIFENTLSNNGFDPENADIDYNTLFSIESGNCYYANINSIGEPQYKMINGTLTQYYPVNYRIMKVQVASETAIKISFDKNGATGNMDDVLIEPDTDYVLPECGFTPRYGEMFDRWWIADIGYKAPGDVINVSQNTTVKATYKPVPTEPIASIDINFTPPKVGDKVEKKHIEEEYYSYDIPTVFPVSEEKEQNDEYFVDGGIYIVSPEDDQYFFGTFEQGKTYYAEIAIAAQLGYTFNGNDNTSVTVNGKTTGFELSEGNGVSPYFIIYVKFTPSEEGLQEYTLTSGDYTVRFKSEKNREYSLKMFNVLTLTDEELETVLDGMPKEEFNEILSQIKNNVKEYGDLLGIYGIEINSSAGSHTGETEIKIKMTDEMKKYNTFKFIYLDDNNNFKVGEITNFKIEGDYLIGTVPHLSVYALTGTNEPVTNPNTGDNILYNIILLGMSIVGLTTITIYSRKKRLS